MALSSITLEGLALLSFLIWLALFFGWGHFWRVWEFDTDHAQFPSPAKWPGVTAVIPARNEAASIAEVVRVLALQDYAGEFSAIVVDDHSDDGTAELARRAAIKAGTAKVTILSAPKLASGWTGKLGALNAGVASAVLGWVVDAPSKGPERKSPNASADHEKAPGPPTVTEGRMRSPPPEATGAPYVAPPSPDENTTV